MLTQTRDTVGVLAGLVGGMVLMVVLLLGMTGGGFILALFVLVMLSVALGVLAIENAIGYEPLQKAATEEAVAPAALAAPAMASRPTAPAWRPVAIGGLGAVGLFGVYFNLMTAWEGLPHTAAHLRTDWAIIFGVMAGFAVLASVATHAYTTSTLSRRTFTFGVVGSGIGLVGLLSCCTPLLIHVFPWPVVLQAAIFTIQYSVPIIILGIAANVVSSFALTQVRTRAAVVAT